MPKTGYQKFVETRWAQLVAILLFLVAFVAVLEASFPGLIKGLATPSPF